eukprot:1009316-Amphidinium_carterae.1
MGVSSPRRQLRGMEPMLVALALLDDSIPSTRVTIHTDAAVTAVVVFCFLTETVTSVSGPTLMWIDVESADDDDDDNIC